MFMVGLRSRFFLSLWLVASLSGCGDQAANLVLVKVNGLSARITELYVTMLLDDTSAKNSRPVPESGKDGFVVHEQMERFGISVPDNTQRVSVDVKGFDTNRSVLGQGTGVLELAKGRELAIELTEPK
jgi:hypothetical protein